MYTFEHHVAGEVCRILVPANTASDRRVARDWMDSRRSEILGLDTETTGLAIFAPGFRVRTVQIGDRHESLVLRVGREYGLRDLATELLCDHESEVVLHNAGFDLLALDATGIVPLEHMLPRSFDTYILAHLLDPRAAGEDGSPGLSLKALASLYISPDAEDGSSELSALFRASGRTRATGWDLESLPEHETYLRYAGLDPIYARRLLDELGPMVRAHGLSALARWEHRILGVITRMTRRGVHVDVPYTTGLSDSLRAEADRYADIAAGLGVSNVNSVAQIRRALTDAGVELRERTATGAYSVGADVLLPLAGLTPYWSPIPDAPVDPLADAIVRSKRSRKWATAYAGAFLTLMDENAILHPVTNALAARTGRMSISSPPLQQLPSSDWTIRRSLVAGPGRCFVSTDFSQVELRVLAANAGVSQMAEAIRTGADLHDRTANLIWGEGQWGKRQRGVAKSVAFLKVYGGGVSKLAKTAGIPQAEARAVFDAFSQAYPEVDKHSRRLQRQASAAAWTITTPTGRRLPLSRDRSYAALNYETQSVARDLFARALLAVSDAGLEDHLVLPIHDELVTVWDVADAEDGAREVARLMTSEYRGIPIDADSEVGWGGSWGSLYGVPAHLDAEPGQHERRKVKA